VHVRELVMLGSPNGRAAAVDAAESELEEAVV
jgi:hypothetical protein